MQFVKVDAVQCLCKIEEKLAWWYVYATLAQMWNGGCFYVLAKSCDAASLCRLSSRDGPNVRLWHSAEAEGLGTLTERVPNVWPNFGLNFVC